MVAAILGHPEDRRMTYSQRTGNRVDELFEICCTQYVTKMMLPPMVQERQVQISERIHISESNKPPSPAEIAGG